MTDVYIGRQPIFDRDLNVTGYELLYRSAEMDHAQFMDGDHATAAVISNTFLEIGLERLVGNKLAFINLTRSFLTGQYPLPQDHSNLVLEILEDITIDQELIEAVDQLRKQGFTLALDDVTRPEDVERILGLTHIVKVDLMLTNHAKLPQQISVYQRHKVKLLAEKIETQAEFEFCKNLGFDYFQGYFLCRPNVHKEKKLSSSKMSILQLLAEMHNPDVEFTVIEETIQQDVTMSFKLLRLINSAFYGMRSEITSVKQALTLLGLRQIQSWVSLLLISESENKPHELMKISMIRAKMSERLALAENQPRPEVFFTVGLFSVLDAMLDTTLEKILEQVPLSQDVKQALTQHTGKLGESLRCVLAYENGELEAIYFGSLDGTTIAECYLDAVEWADESIGLLTTYNKV